MKPHPVSTDRPSPTAANRITARWRRSPHRRRAQLPAVRLKLPSHVEANALGAAAYVHRGPPPTAARALGPILSLAIVLVLGALLALTLAGHAEPYLHHYYGR